MRSKQITADQLLMASQAAALAGLKQRRFFTLLAEGRGPKAFLIGKTKYYTRDDVIEWKEEREKEKTARKKR